MYAHSLTCAYTTLRYDWQANTQVSDETCFDVGLWTDWKWNSALKQKNIGYVIFAHPYVVQLVIFLWNRN